MRIIINNKELIEFRSSGFIREAKKIAGGSFISPTVFWADLVNGREIDLSNPLSMSNFSIDDVDLNKCEMLFSIYDGKKTKLLNAEIGRLVKDS